MSNLKQNSGEDYPDASKKNCIDARVLLDNNRFDGAAYLAGYVAECVLKAIISVEKPCGVRKIHNLNGLSSDAVKLFALPNSKTAKYFKSGHITGITYNTPPNGWRECLRYFPENTINKQVATSWVEEAERLYKNVICELIKDGEVKL